MQPLNPKTIIEQMYNARERTLAMVEGLNAQQMMGPKLATINPLIWEIAHATYFYEFWVLRHHLGQAPLRGDVDKLFDSINIAHDDRWDLPLPTLKDTLNYMQQVLENVEKALLNGDDATRDYLAQYAVFHEDMHTEAYTYTRQTLSYRAPNIGQKIALDTPKQKLVGDACIPGGQFLLGATKNQHFVFDNEKWAHPQKVTAFSIAKTAVSNADYLAFVQADGYKNQQYWSDEGKQWLAKSQIHAPIYWQQKDGNWQIKQFDKWIAMPKESAVVHVNYYEASAYCKWAKRRLPTELEWEVAAAGKPNKDGTLSQNKNYYPWGKTEATKTHANLNGYALGTINVNALPNGDSAFGCRQMIGNVWEWTSSTFSPYPSFTPDMYKDYSQPLFGTTKVLRGGAWTTRGRMIRNTWRTYYGKDRNDVFAGFRTCAL